MNNQKRLLHVLRSMLNRCGNPKSQNYKHYGGRGISVCSDWVFDGGAFVTWAEANGYKVGLSIERKDNNGPYSPENCCWIPMGSQVRNTTRTRRFPYQGEQLLAAEIFERTTPAPGLTKHALFDRLNHGWPVDEAVSKPLNKSKARKINIKFITKKEAKLQWL